MTAELRRHWLSLLPARPGLGEELISRWSEPHRRYHDPAHLVWALRALAELGGTSRVERLALWFHDAVHTGTPGSDELASAELAVANLTTAGLPAAEVDEVARLVLVTFAHAPDPRDVPGSRVSDADLAILGSEPSVYQVSVASLRAESPELDEAGWRDLRLARLAELLDGTPIFHTGAGRELWGARAVANLTAERSTLLGTG